VFSVQPPCSFLAFFSLLTFFFVTQLPFLHLLYLPFVHSGLFQVSFLLLECFPFPFMIFLFPFQSPGPPVISLIPEREFLPLSSNFLRYFRSKFLRPFSCTNPFRTLFFPFTLRIVKKKGFDRFLSGVRFFALRYSRGIIFSPLPLYIFSLP